MSSQQRSASQAGAPEKTYFEQQREALIGEIAMSFEHVLANINKLNRSLEAVTAVGHEFSSVEALWSQFENVMAKEERQQQGGGGGHGDAEGPRREGEEVATGTSQGEAEDEGDHHEREDDTMPTRSAARG